MPTRAPPTHRTQSGGKYPNAFWRDPSDGLLRVSWFGEAGEPVTGPSLRRVVGGGGEEAVLLFCRVRQGPYVFCGRVACERAEPPEGPGACATASLVLQDTEALDASPAFGAVLRAQMGTGGGVALPSIAGEDALSAIYPEVTAEAAVAAAGARRVYRRGG